MVSAFVQNVLEQQQESRVDYPGLHTVVLHSQGPPRGLGRAETAENLMLSITSSTRKLPLNTSQHGQHKDMAMWEIPSITQPTAFLNLKGVVISQGS